MPLLKLSWVFILLVLGLCVSYESRAEKPNESQNSTPSNGKYTQPNQKNPTSSQKQTSKDERGTERMPLVIKGIPAEKSPEQTTEDRKEREIKIALDRDLTIYTGWQAIFTFILIVVGIFQLGLFIWQLRLIRESLVDTKTAAEAANKSADAAEHTVSTMKDTAERQLRAYVSVDSAEIIDLAAGLTPAARLIVKNSGQTPAYNLTGIGGIAIGESFEKLPPPTGSTAMSKSSLSAGAIADQLHQAPQPLTSEAMAALIAGTVILWVYGELHYRDTFDVIRFTKYRFQVGGTAGIRGNRMAICEEGNEQN